MTTRSARKTPPHTRGRLRKPCSLLVSPLLGNETAAESPVQANSSVICWQAKYSAFSGRKSPAQDRKVIDWAQLIAPRRAGEVGFLCLATAVRASAMRTTRASEQVLLAVEERGAAAQGDAELPVDRGEMPVDGTRADDQLLSYPGIGESLRLCWLLCKSGDERAEDQSASCAEIASAVLNTRSIDQPSPVKNGLMGSRSSLCSAGGMTFSVIANICRCFSIYLVCTLGWNTSKRLRRD
jgi:hypothetical protein